jgi:hypothetical protein
MEDVLDSDGNLLVPTHIPPRTSFPYPVPVVPTPANLLHRQTTDAASSSSTAVPESSDTTLSAPSSPPLKPSQPPEELAFAPFKSRPTLPKHITEAPRPTPRANLGAAKRGATVGRPAQLNHDSSSDSSSSDDELEQSRKSRKSKGKHAGEDNGRRKINRRASSSEPYSRFNFGNENFSTRGKVSRRDGRLNISVNETANTGYLAKALGSSVKHHILPSHRETVDDVAVQSTEGFSPQNDEIVDDSSSRPRLNIVVIVIGSRGDIQPFLKIGKILKNEYGHRVRIATHPAFKEFVEKDSGLEFFSVGGNPSELMAFMVKNPGLIPSIDTVKAGEIGRRRAAMYEMFQGMWRACINATDDEHDLANIKMMGDKNPFVADAIIANPPSFAHVHIAERLGIPLHVRIASQPLSFALLINCRLCLPFHTVPRCSSHIRLQTLNGATPMLTTRTS